ncbi:ABC transporter permease [Salinadaptatus halalkaliphilus]|uniref:ABC transporter permease n=1 Tax=Salinadaptatus halalkaliphilus TaxID=2419781 RepID=A0A4S3TJ03_9EURY|nr:ABC transporter permease [Salinadaptatus halalkaliphilus]THE63942.1 ABC transporter permease [Salinadaptatus halalkaliphilus]
MSRLGYLARRLLLAIPVVLFGTSLTFLIIRMGPIDPAAAIVGSPDTPSAQAQYERTREQLGLTQPLWDQYVEFMTDLLLFDLGQSWVLSPGTNTYDLILTYAPRTLWLGFWSILIAVFVGIPLGFYAGLNPNTRADYLVSFGGIVWRAMPNFWLAIILLALFAQSQQYFFGFDWSGFVVDSEVTGAYQFSDITTSEGFVREFKRVLPAALVLGSASMGNEMRIGRTAVLETINSNYVETAKAKGLSTTKIVWKHVFRNALIPLVPVITSEAFLLIGGAVLVEVVFGINGLGYLFFQAVINGDLPLVASLMYVFILVLVGVNIIQDILYTIIDPRVGLEEGSA